MGKYQRQERAFRTVRERAGLQDRKKCYTFAPMPKHVVVHDGWKNNVKTKQQTGNE
jgi:hypothetical protein